MDESRIAPERPGILERLFGRRDLEFEETKEVEQDAPVRRAAVYTCTVRRHVIAFDDALAAADGLKRGEMQVLNLTSADPTLREKIKDFLSGVNYAQEGTWEEVGEHIYLLAPEGTHVECSPPSPGGVARQN
jgi:cell division inhibitor SepF